MHRFVCVLCLVAILPISAYATPSITSSSCSSSLTSELVNRASFSCACNSSITAIQNTSNKIISWSTFNLSQGDAVNFNQGQPSKVTLNSALDTNQTPSGVLTLNDSGSIYLVNPSGVSVQPNNTPSTRGGSLVISSGSVGLTAAGNKIYTPPISLSAVPEPSTYLMMLFGLGLINYRRQFKH